MVVATGSARSAPQPFIDARVGRLGVGVRRSRCRGRSRRRCWRPRPRREHSRRWRRANRHVATVGAAFSAAPAADSARLEVDRRQLRSHRPDDDRDLRRCGLLLGARGGRAGHAVQERGKSDKDGDGATHGSCPGQLDGRRYDASPRDPDASRSLGRSPARSSKAASPERRPEWSASTMTSAHAPYPTSERWKRSRRGCRFGHGCAAGRRGPDRRRRRRRARTPLRLTVAAGGRSGR